MKLRIEIDVDDDLRAAIQGQVGKQGLANKAEIREWIMQCIKADGEAICSDGATQPQEDE